MIKIGVIIVAVSIASIIIYNNTNKEYVTYKIEQVPTSGNSSITALKIPHVYGYSEPIPSYALPPDLPPDTIIRSGFSAPPQLVQRAYFKEIAGFKDIKFINGDKNDIYNNFMNLYEFVIEPGTKAYFTVVFDASDPIENVGVDNNGNPLAGLEEVVGSKEVTEEKLLKRFLKLYPIKWLDNNIAAINKTLAIIGKEDNVDINTIDGLNIDIDAKIVEPGITDPNVPYFVEMTYTFNTDESVEQGTYIYRVNTHYFGIITIGDKAYGY